MIDCGRFADNLPMDTAKRTLNIIRAALLASVALYMFVGEQLVGGKAGPVNALLFQVMAIVAVANVVLILVVRRSMVAPSLAALRSNANDPAALNRWRAGYVITYALCEAVALYGFILRIMRFSFRIIVPFYLASVILMIYFGPRSVETQSSAAVGAG
jgi:hypothetical protein